MAPHARTREIRLRRAAERQGVAISKSRRRDPRALDFDTWTLDDPHRQVNLVGITLDDVERYLLTGESPAGA